MRFGARHCAAAIERDAPHQLRHARGTIRTQRHGRNAAAERHRDVAAVTIAGKRAARGVVERCQIYPRHCERREAKETGVWVYTATGAFIAGCAW